jgi:hypothetical protein
MGFSREISITRTRFAIRRVRADWDRQTPFASTGWFRRGHRYPRNTATSRTRCVGSCFGRSTSKNLPL